MIKKDMMDKYKENIFAKDFTGLFSGNGYMCFGTDPSKIKFEIKEIIANNPFTIINWVDGTKTVVKCQDQEYDLEKGIVYAIAKRAMGMTKILKAIDKVKIQKPKEIPEDDIPF